MAENSLFDAVIIGGGAAGLMCAIAAGQRGRKVLVIEHANRCGKKILMSGGGRCNFTNTGTAPTNFLSANPHFCKSALARYRPAEGAPHGRTWGPLRVVCAQCRAGGICPPRRGLSSTDTRDRRARGGPAGHSDRK